MTDFNDERDPEVVAGLADQARERQREDAGWAGVHTCHAECPCQTGGQPVPDFEEDRLDG